MRFAVKQLRSRIEKVERIGRFVLLAAVTITGSVCSNVDTTAPGAPQGPDRAARFRDHTSPAVSALSATQGQWDAPFTWVNVAVHLSLLPDGRVLSFGRMNGGTPQIWDPGTGTFTGIPAPSLLYCGGQVFLPDGRLFVAGGHIASHYGLPNTNYFDFTTNTWTPGPVMARGRWYPSATVLPGGQVLVIAGTDQNAKPVTIPEVLTPAGTWRRLTSASRQLPNYPRMFLAPNGKAFYAGELQQTAYLATSGTGKWTNVALRVRAARAFGAAVMYQPGKVLYAGGGSPPTATAEVIDLNQATPRWRLVGSLASARRHLNLTLLPDGRVVAIGGTSAPGFSDPSGAVHAAEVWNPATEQWTTWASNAVTRIYHSTAILLADGRLLSAGSGDTPTPGAQQDELNGEIFEPPYLFLGPRPTITSVPTQWGYNQVVQLQSPQAASVKLVSLVRLMSTTHAHDMNQRWSAVPFTRSGTTLTLSTPARKNLVPPGNYMLFLVDVSGAPSVATMVRIQ